MTKVSNTPLTTEKLLHDDRFVRAVIAGEAAIEAYQKKYIAPSVDAQRIVAKAKAMILSMRQSYQSQSLSSKTKKDLLDKIRSRDRD
ncbi:MAG: hypothetical protein HRU12_08135 [Phaeodactylibacter sp.]|nr:hypothetical protein [Phaeodactylibacter sp.]